MIVNSASNDLDLGRGKASLALLKAGGSSIQADCNQKYPNGISVGEVAVTTAGDLKCKNILHICLEAYSHKKSVDYLEVKAIIVTESFSVKRGFTALPNHRILDWSKFKAFADEKISLTQTLKFVFGMVENIVRILDLHKCIYLKQV